MLTDRLFAATEGVAESRGTWNKRKRREESEKVSPKDLLPERTGKRKEKERGKEFQDRVCMHVSVCMFVCARVRVYVFERARERGEERKRASPSAELHGRTRCERARLAINMYNVVSDEGHENARWLSSTH